MRTQRSLTVSPLVAATFLVACKSNEQTGGAIGGGIGALA